MVVHYLRGLWDWSHGTLCDTKYKRAPFRWASLIGNSGPDREVGAFYVATAHFLDGCSITVALPIRGLRTADFEMRQPERPGVPMAASVFSGMRGRRKFAPAALARAKPARARSWIIARSNSAN